MLVIGSPDARPIIVLNVVIVYLAARKNCRFPSCYLIRMNYLTAHRNGDCGHLRTKPEKIFFGDRQSVKTILRLTGKRINFLEFKERQEDEDGPRHHGSKPEEPDGSPWFGVSGSVEIAFPTAIEKAFEMLADEKVSQEPRGFCFCEEIPGQGDDEHEDGSREPRKFDPNFPPTIVKEDPGSDRNGGENEGDGAFGEESDGESQEEEVAHESGAGLRVKG